MTKVSATQWEQARADYEGRGVSIADLAGRLKVNHALVSRRAKRENWRRGGDMAIVDKKVQLLKMGKNLERLDREIAADLAALPPRNRYTLEAVLHERLQAEGLLAEADCALAEKIIDLARETASAEELELLSRARKNLAPPAPRDGATINISQQQAIQAASPAEALAQITLQARETPEQ